MREYESKLVNGHSEFDDWILVMIKEECCELIRVVIRGQRPPINATSWPAKQSVKDQVTIDAPWTSNCGGQWSRWSRVDQTEAPFSFSKSFALSPERPSFILTLTQITFVYKSRLPTRFSAIFGSPSSLTPRQLLNKQPELWTNRACIVLLRSIYIDAKSTDIYYSDAAVVTILIPPFSVYRSHQEHGLYWGYHRIYPFEF